MIVDLEKPIKDLEGNIVTEADEPVLAKTLVIRALTILGQDDEKASGDERYRRYKLALDITEQKRVNLKSEDIADIKKLVGKMYMPIIVGRVYDILEGNDSE
jgi:hypothetical protein